MAVVNNLAYVEKALPGVVDKVFRLSSRTESLIGGGEIKLDFLDARTVKVFNLASTGLYDYQRGGHGNANGRGAVKSTTETFTLSQERYSEIPLDRLDSLDDGDTVLGHLAAEFIATKVVPEFDTYRFSKLAGYTSLTYGNRVVESISANEIIAKFNAGFKWLSNQRVPQEDQVIFVSTTVMQLIRNTTELAKRLYQSDMDKNVKFSIEKYEGRDIVEVPEDMFYTDAQTGDGIYPSSGSKVINFLIVSKKAPIIVKKLDFAKVYNSTDENGAYLGYVGYLFANLYYHDLFVPENKVPGIYCSVSTTDANTVGRALLVDAVAGASGKSHLVRVLTQPAGLAYDKIELLSNATTTKPAIGASVSGTQIYAGADFTPNDDHNIIVATLDGKVVAVSQDFEDDLPVGA